MNLYWFTNGKESVLIGSDRESGSNRFFSLVFKGDLITDRLHRMTYHDAMRHAVYNSLDDRRNDMSLSCQIAVLRKHGIDIKADVLWQILVDRFKGADNRKMAEKTEVTHLDLQEVVL